MKVKKIVDLSWEITEKTSIYPEDPQPKIDVFCTIETMGYNLFSLQLGTQTGTHLDAPYHLVYGTETIDKIPLDYFFGEAIVMDATNKNELEEIALDEVKAYTDKLNGRKIFLIRTDWYKKLGTDSYLKHPYLTVEAAQHLIDMGVRLVCVDTLNLDKSFNAKEFPVHVLFAKNRAIIGENMAYFDHIDFENPIISALPLNLRDCDGSPTRAIALQIEI